MHKLFEAVARVDGGGEPALDVPREVDEGLARLELGGFLPCFAVACVLADAEQEGFEPAQSQLER